MGYVKKSYNTFVRNPERIRRLRESERETKIILKCIIKEMGTRMYTGCVFSLAGIVNTVMCSIDEKAGSLLTRLATVSFLTRALLSNFTIRYFLIRSNSLPSVAGKENSSPSLSRTCCIVTHVPWALLLEKEMFYDACTPDNIP
jgi:hypothetical protein